SLRPQQLARRLNACLEIGPLIAIERRRTTRELSEECLQGESFVPPVDDRSQFPLRRLPCSLSRFGTLACLIAAELNGRLGLLLAPALIGVLTGLTMTATASSNATLRDIDGRSVTVIGEG